MNPYWTVNLSDSPFWKGRGAAGKVSRKAGGATAAVIEPLSALLSVESALGTRHEVEREAATSRPAKLQARILLAGQSPAAALGWLDAFTNCECRKSGAASMEARETETMSSSQSPVKPMLEPAERYKGLPTYTLAKVLRSRLGGLSWTEVRKLIAARRVKVGDAICSDDARRLKDEASDTKSPLE